MGVPTSEVGYTPAMPRREDHEVHKGHVAGEKKLPSKVARSGHRKEVAVPVLWPVPEAVVTVFSTPDDGCGDTRNM